MGLLGGFKGKLIGKEKKEKKFPPSRIVCVKYSTFSEFESPNDIPSCSNSNLGRNDVIKEKKKLPKPEIKNLFGENGVKVNGTAKPPPKPSNGATVKPPNVTNVETDTPSKVTNAANNSKLSNSAAAKPPKVTTPETAKPPKVTKAETVGNSKPPEVKNPEITKPPVKKQAPKPTTNTSKTSKLTKTKAPEVPSTPILLKKPPEDFSTVNDDDDSPIILKGPKLFSLSNDTDSDDDIDGNFKIHIAQNHGNNFDSSSEDEHQVEPSPIDFSSQAASIFFGEMEEPTVRRPRNIIVNDDDDGNSSDGSSASA